MFRIISKVLLATAAITAVSMSLAAPMVSAHGSNNQTCVDGNKRSNFAVTWNSTDSVTVKTVGDKLLCEDTTLWFSSYTLPDNYNGKGFSNNPTASPQTIFDSASKVLAKGTNGATTFKVNIPEACKGMQIDLYYGPEITFVTAAGHGNQYITGKILSKTQETCTPITPEEPPVIPEVPVPEAETPPTEPPVVVVTPQVTELPKTGAGLNAVVAATIIATAAGYAVAQAASKRQ
jgi:hypothetical protein